MRTSLILAGATVSRHRRLEFTPHALTLQRTNKKHTKKKKQKKKKQSKKKKKKKETSNLALRRPYTI